MEESIEYKGYTIELERDEDPVSPRENENLGRMFAWHREYTLGDIYRHVLHGKEDLYFREPEELIDWENEHRKDIVILKTLYILDHSGVWMRTSHFMEDPGGWDTSRVGHILVTKQDIRKWFGASHVTTKLIVRAETLLDTEVETYNSYLSGDVYCVRVWKDDPENEYSTCGYIGYNNAVEATKEHIDSILRMEAVHG